MTKTMANPYKIFGFWITSFVLLIATNAAYSSPESSACMPYKEMTIKADATKHISVVNGNLIINSEAGLKEWKVSKHQIGDDEMTGEELDNYMTNMRDPAIQKKIANSLRKKGVSEAAIQKGQKETQELIEIKTRERRRKVTEKTVGVVMMEDTTSTKGYMLFGDRPLNNPEVILCRKIEFNEVTPYRYKGRTPSYFYNYGKMFLAIEYFKLAYNYGVLAAGFTEDNQTVYAFLGNPEAEGGTENGMILKGTRGGKDNIELFGELINANYGPKLDQAKIPENE